MNRLFSKLKDFGLINYLENQKEEEIILISKSLKRAHCPVALFDFNHNMAVNPIKISHENEDMFLGAFCTNDITLIKKAFASGAHFAISKSYDHKTNIECANLGLDLIVMVNSNDEIQKAISIGVQAIAINYHMYDQLKESISKALECNVALFFKGNIEDLPKELMVSHKNIAALILHDPVLNELVINQNDHGIISQCQKTHQKLLGFNFNKMIINKKSITLENARVFAALSSIPLYLDEKSEDKLYLETFDMDRTISHLKWHDIYIDPLETKIKGSQILETKLYSRLFDWSIILINKE